MREIILKLASFTGSDSKTSVTNHQEKCIGCGIAAMGPEKILKLIPISLDTKNFSFSNTWLLPILKNYMELHSLTSWSLSCLWLILLIGLLDKQKRNQLHELCRLKLVSVEAFYLHFVVILLILSQSLNLLPSYCLVSWRKILIRMKSLVLACRRSRFWCYNCRKGKKKEAVEEKKPMLPLKPVSKADKMRECLRFLKKNHKDEVARVKKAFQTLLTYVGNVARSPNEEKFRKIRLTNQAFQDRVGGLKGGIEFLELCGFEKVEGGEFLLLPRDKVDIVVLNTAGQEVQSAIDNPHFGVL